MSILTIKSKNIQTILDLSISAFFVLCSMAILKFFLPSGLTTDFLVRGFKLIGLIFIFTTVLFLFFLYFNKNFKFKKKI